MPRSIGLIIASTRNPRINPQIAEFVLQTIKAAHPTNAQPTIQKIDLAAWNLPFFDEPWIPTLVKDPADYKHEHTRAWSREIARHDAFIFVSPQYNWGYPAPLKNALDFLFNEWTGKPAMIVTYGGHGGVKCAEQLQSVLGGMRLRLAENHVELTYPDMGWAKANAFPGTDLALDANSDDGLWAEKRPEIVSVFKELTVLMEEKDAGGK